MKDVSYNPDTVQKRWLFIREEATKVLTSMEREGYKSRRVFEDAEWYTRALAAKKWEVLG